MWGFLAAAAIIGVQWYFNVKSIRASVARCPDEKMAPPVEESKLPWKRKY